MNLCTCLRQTSISLFSLFDGDRNEDDCNDGDDHYDDNNMQFYFKLMLKIVSSLNGFSVRQSVVSDGPRYRAAVAVKKYIIFKMFVIIFQKKILKNWKKMIFW